MVDSQSGVPGEPRSSAPCHTCQLPIALFPFQVAYRMVELKFYLRLPIRVGDSHKPIGVVMRQLGVMMRKLWCLLIAILVINGFAFAESNKVDRALQERQNSRKQGN